MDMSVIANILNTGVTGFAFLMLFLGFKLTSNVQAKILEHKSSDFNNIEMYREWKGLIASQLTNTRYFIGFSLLFFAGGLFLLMHQAESKITVATSPEQLPFQPRVFLQDNPMNFNEGNSLKVKNGQSIRVSYDEPIAKIRELKDSLASEKRIIKSLMIDKASLSDDAGF
jgi:hypothetical protein